MTVAVALHFGGNYGTASWEPIARARCFLAGWMYRYTHHQQELNADAFVLFDLPDKEDLSEPCTVWPHFDEFNKPVVNKDGAFVPEFWMFVDNRLSAIPRQEKNTRHFIASNIESLYVLIGYPGLIKNPTLPPTMSWDKMADRAVGPIRDSLGVQFLNRKLEITVEDYKVEWLLELLNSAWLGNIKGSTALVAAVLIGNIYAVTLTCAWLNWSCHHLIGAMKRQIRKNYESLRRQRPVHTKDIEKLFAEIDKQCLDPPFKRFARNICHSQSILKAVWQLQDKHWMTKDIKEELLYMKTQCLQHINGIHRWVRPISHFIKRKHEGKIRQDVSTDWGMGGGLGMLTYWWQLS